MTRPLAALLAGLVLKGCEELEEAQPGLFHPNMLV
jgi:hypothetical protein